jgi:HEAT repeat protein
VKRAIIVTVLFAAIFERAAWAADGGAAPPAASTRRQTVEAALVKPAAAGDLPRLAATSADELRTIAADRGASETVRGRALSALAYARDGRTHAFLENFVVATSPSSDATDRVLLRRAAVALGWQGGARVVETIAPLLDHPDADVRIDGAVALGLSRARDAAAPLRARLAIEPDAVVRRQIQAAISAAVSAR